MRAKFKCTSVEKFETCVEANLMTDYGASKEDQEFNNSTPAAELSITIDKKSAISFFEPGKFYFLDFTPAD